MKQFLIGLVFGLSVLFNSVQAHDIPPEILQFLAKNPDATEAEFNAFIETLENAEEFVVWGQEEVSGGFNLPPELVEFLLENPEANEPEILEFISANPQLEAEKWDESIKQLISGDGFDDGSPFSLNDLVLLNQVQSTFDEVYSDPGDINWFQFTKNYVNLGIEHILIGLDHILFVVVLVLLLPPWRKILTVISVFTLAHSITLILAGLGLVNMPGSIVEPLIAASIVYVAVTTVFLSKKYPKLAEGHNRLMVIFIFGLFHGLGFAGVFAEAVGNTSNLLASLLFFNIGVEIGQILILLAVLPVLYLIYGLKIDRYVIPFLAVLMSLLATWWVIVRVFF